jgi:uncharacterized damage-inducible protein DinB
MQRPQPGEYIPYYQKYIDMIPEGPFEQSLQENTWEVTALFSNIPEEKQHYRYAPGKWTIKEVLMHIIDTERAISFRALVAARGDKEMPLFTMEENMYADNSGANDRTLDSIVQEFAAIRRANELLLLNLPEEKTTWCCNLKGHMVSVRSLAYMMMGHAKHHVVLVKERYL